MSFFTRIPADPRLESARSELDANRRQLMTAEQAREEANQRVSVLEQNLAAKAAISASLESQLQQAKEENTFHQQQTEDARREFAAELDNLRAAAQVADERFRATETRALLEIDRERTAGTNLRKELDKVRSAAIQAAERHKFEIAGLQEQLGDLKRKSGILEGNLQAVLANRETTVNELKAAQARLVEAAEQQSLIRATAENWQRQAEESLHMVAELRDSIKVTRAPRKVKE